MKRTFTILVLGSALIVSCAHRHQQHAGSHAHTHGNGCGHIAIVHDGHEGYLHDGHLHCLHAGHVDEHTISLTAANPDQCTPTHGSSEHAKHRRHGQNCGHPAVPHGDHTDYLINGHLHHAHSDHCDDHGAIQVASR